MQIRLLITRRDLFLARNIFKLKSSHGTMVRGVNQTFILLLVALLFQVFFFAALVAAIVEIPQLEASSSNITNQSNVTKVAYLYRLENKIDYNILAIFSSLNFSVDLIQENTMPASFENYTFIFIGDESFRKPLPITNYSSLVINPLIGQVSGLTDSDGISRLTASQLPLNIIFKGKLQPAYNSSKDNRGIFISYYFLDNKNKAKSLKRFASTPPTGAGQDLGDVISFAKKNQTLFNKKVTQGNICFFGIADTRYWTNLSQELFRTCAKFSAGLENPIICSSDLECFTDDATTPTCVNPGTTESYCSNQLHCTLPTQCGQPKTIRTCSTDKKTVIDLTTTPTCEQNLCSESLTENLIEECEIECADGACNLTGIACFRDADCDDKDPATDDHCLLPKKKNAQCEHTPLPLSKIKSINATATQTSVTLKISFEEESRAPVAGFYIKSDGNWQFVKAPAKEFTFSDLTPSTVYNFTVKLLDSFNRSSNESRISIKTLDAPQPPTPPSSGSSGGGGSAPTKKGNKQCVIQWFCTEWSECINNLQTRTCEQKPLGPCLQYLPSSKPAEFQSCGEQVLLFQPINPEENTPAPNVPPLENLPLESETQNNDQGRSPITGATIGAPSSSTWLVTLIFLAAMIILYIAVKQHKIAKITAGKVHRIKV